MREFIYSELRLHSKQSPFRVWYSFPTAQKMGRLVHTRYSALIFGVFLLLDRLPLQWLRNLHLPVLVGRWGQQPIYNIYIYIYIYKERESER